MFSSINSTVCGHVTRRHRGDSYPNNNMIVCWEQTQRNRYFFERMSCFPLNCWWLLCAIWKKNGWGWRWFCWGEELKHILRTKTHILCLWVNIGCHWHMTWPNHASHAAVSSSSLHGCYQSICDIGQPHLNDWHVITAHQTPGSSINHSKQDLVTSDCVATKNHVHLQADQKIRFCGLVIRNTN